MRDAGAPYGNLKRLERRGASRAKRAVGIGLAVIVMVSAFFIVQAVAPHSGASTSPAPASTVAWVPLTIYNNQSVGTGTYQQLVDFDSASYSAYLNTNDSNLRFTYDANQTNIPAWIQANDSSASTNTQIWLRLYNIPADSTTKVDALFGSKTAYYWSWSGSMGVYPNATTSYGVGDNGAQVFNYYTNFSGTSLPSSLLTKSGLAGTGTTSPPYAVDNGLSFHVTNPGGQDVGLWFYTTTTYPAGDITEANASHLLPNGFLTGYIANIGIAEINTTGGYNTGPCLVPSTDGFSECASYNNAFMNGIQRVSTWGQTTQGVIGIRWNTNNLFDVAINASWSLGYSFPWSTPVVYAPSVGIYPYSAAYVGGYVNWLRVRADPPNTVMPTPVPGPVQFSVTIPTGLTIAAITDDAALANWTLNLSKYSVVGIDAYLYGDANCSNSPTMYSMGAVTTYTFTSLVADALYSVRVAGFSALGPGALSACAPFRTALPPVYGVTQDAHGLTWMTLAWTVPYGYPFDNVSVYVSPPNSECGYNYSLSSGWGRILSVGHNTTYNLTGLAPSDSYCVGVVAWNGNATAPYTLDVPSAFSDTLFASTSPCTTTCIVVPPPPPILSSGDVLLLLLLTGAALLVVIYFAMNRRRQQR